MGRTVGFEPTHNGTTIHGLNRLTMPAMSYINLYQPEYILSLQADSILYINKTILFQVLFLRNLTKQSIYGKFFSNECFLYIIKDGKMTKFIKRLTELVLRRKKSRLHCEYKKITRKTRSGGSKFYAHGDLTLEISAKTEQELEKRDFYTKNIVKKYLKNPEGMLDYIEQHGTPVYRIDNADVLLDFIKEEEGLILPKKGFKALYLNILLAVFGKKKLTLKMSTGDMFILRNMPVNVYSMLHQFHKWMSFKMNLPGCEDETQSLMRDMMYNRTGSGELSIDEIMALKDAIARDREAIDFVINLAKETEGAKNAMKKLKDDGSANI